jgi:hypothetical protein
VNEEGKENFSDIYQIKILDRYERAYEKILKKHYKRKNKEKEQFEELIQEYIEKLKNNPIEDSDLEPFPKGSAHPDLEFRKKRWRRLPGLEGAARYGRLLFLISHTQKIVYLVWIYTHVEFQEPNSRPPDKELTLEIRNVKEKITTDRLHDFEQ